MNRIIIAFDGLSNFMNYDLFADFLPYTCYEGIKRLSGPTVPAVYMGSLGNTVSLALDPAGAGVLYVLLDNGDIKSIQFATGDIATVLNSGRDAIDLQFSDG